MPVSWVLDGYYVYRDLEESIILLLLSVRTNSTPCSKEDR